MQVQSEVLSTVGAGELPMAGEPPRGLLFECGQQQREVTVQDLVEPVGVGVQVHLEYGARAGKLHGRPGVPMALEHGQ